MKKNNNIHGSVELSLGPEIAAILVMCFIVGLAILYGKITELKVIAEPPNMDTKSESYVKELITGSSWNIGENYTIVFTLIDKNTKEKLKIATAEFAPTLSSQDIEIKIPLSVVERQKLLEGDEYLLIYDMKNSKDEYIMYHQISWGSNI